VVCVSLGLSVPLIYAGTLYYGLLGTAAAIAAMYALQTAFTAGAALYVLRQPSRLAPADAAGAR
jgi:hypothetical protein